MPDHRATFAALLAFLAYYGNPQNLRKFLDHFFSSGRPTIAAPHEHEDPSDGEYSNSSDITDHAITADSTLPESVTPPPCLLQAQPTPSNTTTSTGLHLLDTITATSSSDIFCPAAATGSLLHGATTTGVSAMSTYGAAKSAAPAMRLLPTFEEPGSGRCSGRHGNCEVVVFVEKTSWVANSSAWFDRVSGHAVAYSALAVLVFVLCGIMYSRGREIAEMEKANTIVRKGNADLKKRMEDSAKLLVVRLSQVKQDSRSKSGKIASLEKDAATERDDLTQKNGDIARLGKTIQDRSQDLQQIVQDLKNRDAVVHNLKIQLSDRDNELNRMTGEVERLTAELNRQNKKLVEKDEDIRKQGVTIGEKSLEINDSNKQLRWKTVELDQSNNQIKKAEARIKTNNKTTEELRQDVKHRDGEIKERDGKLRETAEARRAAESTAEAERTKREAMKRERDILKTSLTQAETNKVLLVEEKEGSGVALREAHSERDAAEQQSKSKDGIIRAYDLLEKDLRRDLATASKEKIEVEEDLGAADKKLASYEHEKADQHAELEDLRSKFQHSQQSTAALDEVIKTCDGQAQKVQELLQSNKQLEDQVRDLGLERYNAEQDRNDAEDLFDREQGARKRSEAAVQRLDRLLTERESEMAQELKDTRGYTDAAWAKTTETVGDLEARTAELNDANMRIDELIQAAANHRCDRTLRSAQQDASGQEDKRDGPDDRSDSGYHSSEPGTPPGDNDPTANAELEADASDPRQSDSSNLAQDMPRKSRSRGGKNHNRKGRGQHELPPKLLAILEAVSDDDNDKENNPRPVKGVWRCWRD